MNEKFDMAALIRQTYLGCAAPSAPAPHEDQPTSAAATAAPYVPKAVKVTVACRVCGTSYTTRRPQDPICAACVERRDQEEAHRPLRGIFPHKR